MVVDSDILSEMSLLIAGVEFDSIPNPEHRAIIVDLALKCEANNLMSDRNETIREIKQTFEDIEVDTTKIADWFKFSSAYRG